MSVRPCTEHSDNSWGLLGWHMESPTVGHPVRLEGLGFYEYTAVLNPVATCEWDTKWLGAARHLLDSLRYLYADETQSDRGRTANHSHISFLVEAKGPIRNEDFCSLGW